MWQIIRNDEDIQRFMIEVDFFHDSCLKEAKYLSGAYVNKDLSMYPINNQRILKIIIQRQSIDMPIIEMEFSGLINFNLCPLPENYTCEILDSTLFFKNECIYWSDSDFFSDLNNKTIVCATKLRWRQIDNNIGNEEFYTSFI